MAPLRDGIVFVSVGAFSADAVDGIEVIFADAVEGVRVKYLIFSAAVAVQIGAGGDLRCWLAVAAVLCCRCREEEDEEGEVEPHYSINMIVGIIMVPIYNFIRRVSDNPCLVCLFPGIG